jgi:hypothetical protein
MSVRKTVLLALFVLCMVASAQAAETLGEAFMEGSLNGDVRLLSFDRNYSTPSRQDKKQSSLGANIFYNTAPLYGINAGVGARTSFDLGSPRTADAYELSRTTDNNTRVDYVTLSEYWLQGTWQKTSLKVGAQRLWTPWLKTHDLRMHPKTFRAAKVTSNYFDNLQIDLAHVTEIMGWTEDHFESVSKSQTLHADKDRPVSLVGGVWKPNKQLYIDAYEYLFWDMYNLAHTRLKYTTPLNDTFTTYVDLRAMYQNSTGENLVGDFNTYQLGGIAGLKAYGIDLNMQYAKIGDYNLQKAAGGSSIVLMQIYASGRAQDNVYAAKLAYDFGYVGVKGLSAYVYAGYFDSPGAGKYAKYDMTEIDFNAQYKFSGALDGWKIRARYAICNGVDVDGGDAADFHDARLYLTYKFDFTLNDLI